MQITKHIHSLKIPFTVIDPSGKRIPRFIYAYIIYGKEIWLIDSGVASSEKIILDYLKELGRSPDEISMLILTHSHPDHIGAAKAIREVSGCAVAAHAAERAWIEDVDLQARERPVPGFKSLVGGSVPINRILQDGDVPDKGDRLNMHVIHTPGHSSGSISLWLPEDGALCTADAIPIKGDMPIFEDIVTSASSIRRLKSVPGIKVLLAAWDEPRYSVDSYRIMDDGLEYLQHIHNAVLRVAGQDPSIDSMELCRRALNELGLPEKMANPLIARSFQASLRV